MECTNGKIYMSCGPRSQPSCGADRISSDFASSSDSSNDLGTNCEEGCFCPAGTVAYESRCITVDECPCRLRGKSFESGAVVPKDCNTCVCAKGKWTCTESKCSARCSAVGDPHYTTFDGKRYDFMGKCSYYLVKGNNYSIEAENAACSSAISEVGEVFFFIFYLFLHIFYFFFIFVIFLFFFFFYFSYFIFFIF